MIECFCAVPVMGDAALIAFLNWCLPRLGLRWSGYRKVRRLVGKRLNRRLAELGLADLSAYRTFLVNRPGEWTRLDAMCRIPISRFYRDHAVFQLITRQLLPEIAAMASARGDAAVRCWSAGCASGEEPYTMAILWRFSVAQDWPALRLTLIATDADETMIERAKAACYAASSLKGLPQGWVDRAFIRCGPSFCLAPDFRQMVEFVLQDIRQRMPGGPFDLILCRNLVFTYFDEALQRRVSDRLRHRLRSGGFLVLGGHEPLPDGVGGFVPVVAKPAIYRREACQPV
jgi:chemotaxis protein methyltransferase CheR